MVSQSRAAVAAQPRWSPIDVQELLEAVERSDAEGLRPEDYGAAELISALIAGTPDMDRLADRSALALAHDLNEGAAPAAERSDWHIERQPTDYAAWLDRALASHSVRASFAALLPTDRNYAQLKSALADCHATRSDCRLYEINLDRWRALPRSLGSRYLWVNVPAFRLDLVDNGKVIASHRVIVGKPASRTPLFKAEVTGVTMNPWWNVPCSIVGESIGRLVRTQPKEAVRQGFVASRARDGTLLVRQKPGPANALGRMKLEMANPYDVYIHDTPSRELFAKDERALSHGCVRAEDPVELAQAILGDDRRMELELLLLTGKTKLLPLPTPLPVYVVYFTVDFDPTDGGRLHVYDDIYGRDDHRL
jgi:murein L,D-transpeptidase YcbB/YkuD